MRLLICVPLLLSACLGNGDELRPDALIRQVGQLQDARLDEASGLARSARDPNLLWLINDDGPAVLHAVSLQGKYRGAVAINGAGNTDWEDLAAFSSAGGNYLVIADIGDNEARRDFVSLLVVPEPASDAQSADIAWRIDFSYPDGPRDAEALAVDSSGGMIYVLSKRDIPAVLYTLPLRPAGSATVVATRLASLDKLPQPSPREIEDAAGSGWYWQPTAMDIAADGRSALILTYQGVYRFARGEQQSWVDALSAMPLQFLLGSISQAEAITLAVDGDTAFLTVEKKHAPLYRLDLRPARSLHKNNN